jgi:hypothetical protein
VLSSLTSPFIFTGVQGNILGLYAMADFKALYQTVDAIMLEKIPKVPTDKIIANTITYLTFAVDNDTINPSNHQAF